MQISMPTRRRTFPGLTRALWFLAISTAARLKCIPVFPKVVRPSAASPFPLADQIIGRRRKVPRDTHLYRVGDPFSNLYAIRLGHFKTHQVNPGGDQQVTGFQMAGELLGMDAISAERHHCDAIALEDSEVCEIPFSRLEGLFGEMPQLLHHFHRIMSQEITREQSVMLLLGNMRAEQRFAAFLTNLSSRYSIRGYSSTSFQLRMTRKAYRPRWSTCAA